MGQHNLRSLYNNISVYFNENTRILMRTWLFYFIGQWVCAAFGPDLNVDLTFSCAVSGRNCITHWRNSPSFSICLSVSQSILLLLFTIPSDLVPLPIHTNSFTRCFFLLILASVCLMRVKFSRFSYLILIISYFSLKLLLIYLIVHIVIVGEITSLTHQISSSSVKKMFF